MKLLFISYCGNHSFTNQLVYIESKEGWLGLPCRYFLFGYKLARYE